MVFGKRVILCLVLVIALWGITLNSCDASCLYFLQGSEQDSCGIQNPKDKLKEPNYQDELPEDLPNENSVLSIKIAYSCLYELRGSNPACDLQRVIRQVSYVNSNNKDVVCAHARQHHKCAPDFID